jgi:hypothetical protein
MITLKKYKEAKKRRLAMVMKERKSFADKFPKSPQAKKRASLLRYI